MKTPSPNGPRLGFLQRLYQPVDISSLVFFRVAFGAIMAWEAYRYFTNGWIHRYYIEPEFFFHYNGFEWHGPWPGIGMYVHFFALGILGLFVMLGLWYRVAAPLLFLAFTYVFLLDEANYLNHFYLISLISFLLIWMPAHRAFSIDVLRRPRIRSDTSPQWALWLLRFQVAVPYVFGGIAKLNHDWLRAVPINTWLASRPDFPVLGPLFGEQWMHFAFAYGGLLIDLFAVFFLLWGRTRPFAFVIVTMFHLSNALLFRIGIFPWFMIAATTIYFSPDWPRRLWQRFYGSPAGTAAPLEGAPGLRPGARRKVVAGLLVAWAAAQVLVPLRHFLYPNHVHWTEEGHNFSWHMKLRDKRSTVVFNVTDPATGETWQIDPRRYLSSRQHRKMVNRPRMILKFCHYLEARLREEGYKDVEIRVDALVSLNGRPARRMINAAVDLTEVRNSILPASWILPLEDSAGER